MFLSPPERYFLQRMHKEGKTRSHTPFQNVFNTEAMVTFLPGAVNEEARGGKILGKLRPLKKATVS
ncbi:MAG: hypothetical protein A2787_06220 [Omnitrophica WOR_2 bacterium RIFCSPHIGHO2_01_FULL_48_9]|nr:MAG: hypothetical protein A2787_06220 [Omnitrophica WOR_2 bacterium RIFCSPHIGHO2_01_FULL_48_9]